jgi:DNA polymerase-1
MDEENLSTVPDELAELVLRYRGEKKLLGTYVSPALHGRYSASLRTWREPFIAPDGRIHSNFNQVGARTGRMSSSDPNMQNLPRDDLRFRYAIRADEGFKLVTVDLESIEMVLFAAFAGEGRMKDMILAGEDMHTATAEYLGLTDFIRPGGHVTSARQRGKLFNYSMLYGAGIRSTRKQFRVKEPEAKHLIRKYHEFYPEVGRLQRIIEHKLHERGYVKDPWGRRFYGSYRDAYKMTNYLVQGTAAEVLKEAAVKVHKAGVPLIAFVHDELMAHVPETEAEAAAQIMVAAMVDHPIITASTGLTIQAEAQIVDRWSDAKKLGYVPEYDQYEEVAA